MMPISANALRQWLRQSLSTNHPYVECTLQMVDTPKTWFVDTNYHISTKLLRVRCHASHVQHAMTVQVTFGDVKYQDTYPLTVPVNDIVSVLIGDLSVCMPDLLQPMPQAGHQLAFMSPAEAVDVAHPVMHTCIKKYQPAESWDDSGGVLIDAVPGLTDDPSARCPVADCLLDPRGLFDLIIHLNDSHRWARAASEAKPGEPNIADWLEEYALLNNIDLTFKMPDVKGESE